MELKDIKVGMKVKIPKVLSLGLPLFLPLLFPINFLRLNKSEHEILRSMIKWELGKEQDFLYVVEIEKTGCGRTKVHLGCRPSELGFGYYYPEDLEPYEEPKEEPISKPIEKDLDTNSRSRYCYMGFEDFKAINQIVNEINHTKSERFLSVLVLKDELKKLKEILDKYGI